MNIIHLTHKHARDGEEQCRAVHVDVATDGQHEASDARVYL